MDRMVHRHEVHPVDNSNELTHQVHKSVKCKFISRDSTQACIHAAGCVNRLGTVSDHCRWYKSIEFLASDRQEDNRVIKAMDYVANSNNHSAMGRPYMIRCASEQVISDEGNSVGNSRPCQQVPATGCCSKSLFPALTQSQPQEVIQSKPLHTPQTTRPPLVQGQPSVPERHLHIPMKSLRDDRQCAATAHYKQQPHTRDTAVEKSSSSSLSLPAGVAQVARAPHDRPDLHGKRRAVYHAPGQLPVASQIVGIAAGNAPPPRTGYDLSDRHHPLRVRQEFVRVRRRPTSLSPASREKLPLNGVLKDNPGGARAGRLARCDKPPRSSSQHASCSHPLESKPADGKDVVKSSAEMDQKHAHEHVGGAGQGRVRPKRVADPSKASGAFVTSDASARPPPFAVQPPAAPVRVRRGIVSRYQPLDRELLVKRRLCMSGDAKLTHGQPERLQQKACPTGPSTTCDNNQNFPHDNRSGRTGKENVAGATNANRTREATRPGTAVGATEGARRSDSTTYRFVTKRCKSGQRAKHPVAQLSQSTEGECCAICDGELRRAALPLHSAAPATPAPHSGKSTRKKAVRLHQCGQCHKSMHETCWHQWVDKQLSNQLMPTCPLCRTPF
eukprot:jgi/Ulvmu1/906/UM101_0014.1